MNVVVWAARRGWNKVDVLRLYCRLELHSEP